jgi:hypothetical protein
VIDGDKLMNSTFPMRMVFASLVGVSQGFLLAWTMTLDRSSSNQFFALLSIISLLYFFHLLSSRLFRRSILVITSYLEGLFLFIVTMAAFRIGDFLLGITNLSLRTEIFLFSVAIVFALSYVWAMRRMVKD